jgi:predicted PurR-regulated permease PerM
MKKFVLYIVLGIVAFLFLGWYFSEITLYFIFSLVIAAVLRPITNRISSIHIIGRHIPRWLSVILSFASVFGVLILIVLLFLPLIYAQIELISSYDIEFVFEQIQIPLGRLEGILFNYKLINNTPGYLVEQLKESIINSISSVNIQKTINTKFLTLQVRFLLP